MVGLGIAIFAHNQEFAERLHPPTLNFSKPLFLITIGLLTFYFAGMILNDAKDANVDQIHRPDRPIPCGAIKRRDAWVTGITLLLVGLLLCVFISINVAFWGVLLVIAVCSYTALHHLFVPALGLMGFCRGLTCLLSFVAIAHSFSFIAIEFALGIGLFTMFLTWIGKNEHLTNNKRAYLVWLLAIPPLVPIQHWLLNIEFNIILYVAYLGWLGFASKAFASNKVGQGMHILLAAFCVLDCIYLSVLGELSLFVVSFLCFVLTLGMQRYIKGT